MMDAGSTNTTTRDAAIESVVPALSNRLRALMTQQGVPGVALGIVRDQALVWSAGFGYADIASGRPLDEHTLFGVGSITKTFTALALMQLRDRGALALDDPVVRHIPEFAAVRSRHGRAQDVTIRALLTHRSGLAGEPPSGHWSSLQFPTLREILALLPRVEVVIEPASAFKYCNLGFALLGEIVERISGRPYSAYVQAEILAPLGMTASGFDIEAVPHAHTATGHMSERYQDVPAVAPDPPLNGYAAVAGLRASVADLARWAALQFRTRGDGSVPVLAGKSLGEMHRVSYVEPNWKTGYAMPWIGVRLGENVYLSHMGSVPGFRSMLAFNKLHRIALIALTNKQGHNVAAAIVFEALEMLSARVTRDAPARRAPPVPASPAYRAMLGRYVSEPTWGAILHIEYRGGALRLAAPPDPYSAPPEAPAPLTPTDDAAVFVVDTGHYAGETLTFEYDPDGCVVAFVVGENGYRFRKTD